MKYKTYRDPKGRLWKPHEIVWNSPDGKFATSIMALSEDHARLLLEDLKATGRIEGELLEHFKA